MNEKNPLELISTHPKISRKYSNVAGRPKKNNEIKFTSPPKSMISLLLLREKSTTNNLNSAVQNDSKKVDITPKIGEEKLINSEDPEPQVNQHDSKLKCQNCTYTTNSSSNLIKHSRIHTSEKPYACDRCIFRTNFQNSLKVHQRIHTSERPYTCKHCDYRCNSSSNLKKHCKHRHSKEVNIG